MNRLRVRGSFNIMRQSFDSQHIIQTKQNYNNLITKHLAKCLEITIFVAKR